MSEEKDPEIKITDRRRYNPDGSLREGFTEEEPEPPPAEEEAQEAAPVDAEPEAPSADNVVSFPGGTSKPAVDEDRPEEKAKPATKAAAASAVSAQAATAQQQAAAQQAAQAAAIESAYNQASDASPQAGLPQASFMALLNMLAVEAAMHLGLMETEPGVRTPVDLEAARHMVDMIGMLQEKTRGNLSAEEANVMEQVLADLRMQYVTLARRK